MSQFGGAAGGQSCIGVVAVNCVGMSMDGSDAGNRESAVISVGGGACADKGVTR